MGFSRVKPGSWAFGERLASGELNALDTDHANAIDGVAGGTYNPSNPIIIGGDGLQLNAALVINADLTVGSDSGDDLVIEATTVVNGPWEFATGSAPVFNDGPIFNNTATFNGGMILGATSGDDIEVNGTLTVNNNATIGSSSGDTLTINSSTVFAGPITFNDNLAITGTVELQNDVTIGTNNSDLLDIIGRMRIRRKLEFQVDGRVPMRYMTLPDSNSTIQVSDACIFRIPTGLTGARTYTLGTTDATDGDFMIFYKGATGTLANDAVINSPTANEDRTFASGSTAAFAIYFYDGSSWRLAFDHAA